MANKHDITDSLIFPGDLVVCVSYSSGGSRISDRGAKPHNEGKSANLFLANIKARK